MNRSGQRMGPRALREQVQRSWNFARDACTHQYIPDAGHHRPVQRRKRRHLNLREQVDSDRRVVAFLCEKDFDVHRQHGQLLPGWADRLAEERKQLVRFSRSLSAGPVVAMKRCFDGGGDRKMLHGSSQVSTFVTILQAAHKHRVDARDGDDAELPGTGNGVGQTPAGNGGTHAALNDRWVGCKFCHIERT